MIITELHVIVAEERSDVRDVWSEVHKGGKWIDIRPIGIRELWALCDAALMPGIHAHERLGGKPVPGVSQVLGSSGKSGMPPWVITTAPFAAHVERRQAANGQTTTDIVQDQRQSPEEEAFVVFSKAFQSVMDFNRLGSRPQIQILGIDLQFINLPRGDSWREAEAMRRAYKDTFG